jgi:hypothetical protein
VPKSSQQPPPTAPPSPPPPREDLRESMRQRDRPQQDLTRPGGAELPDLFGPGLLGRAAGSLLSGAFNMIGSEVRDCNLSNHLSGMMNLLVACFERSNLCSPSPILQSSWKNQVKKGSLYWTRRLGGSQAVLLWSKGWGVFRQVTFGPFSFALLAYCWVSQLENERPCHMYLCNTQCIAPNVHLEKGYTTSNVHALPCCRP